MLKICYIKTSWNTKALNLKHPIKVSKLYMTIKFPRLIKLLPGMSREEVERMIVDASRIGQLRVRIDHSKDIIKFGLESDPAPLYVDDEMSIDPLTACRQERVPK